MPVLPRSSNDIRTPTNDITFGGQNGYLINPQQLILGNTPYVRQQIRAVLITAPGAMAFMENPQYQYTALKSLIELRSQKIDGLKSDITNDFDGFNYGNAGEKLEAVTKSSRAVSTPSHEWAVTYGMAEIRWWAEYSRLLILDPDLQAPGIIYSPAFINAGLPYLANMYTFTTLYYEPDPTFTYPTNAWLCTNMQPREVSGIIGKAEKGGGSSIEPLNIEFTSATLIGEGVYNLAKAYMDGINLQNLRPLALQPYVNGIDPNVSAAVIGLASEVDAAVIPVGA